RVDEHRPGAPFRDDQVSVERKASRGERIDRVDARGGTAFLRIDGRGVGGATCGPVWIRIRSLPGYADRGGPLQTFELAFPTCQASAGGTVAIPAGPFVYGGRGEPPTKFPDYIEPEQVVDLGAYRIDKTEASNAQFAPFASLAPYTGYSAPNYP